MASNKERKVVEYFIILIDFFIPKITGIVLLPTEISPLISPKSFIITDENVPPVINKGTTVNSDLEISSQANNQGNKL